MKAELWNKFNFNLLLVTNFTWYKLQLHLLFSYLGFFFLSLLAFSLTPKKKKYFNYVQTTIQRRLELIEKKKRHHPLSSLQTTLIKDRAGEPQKPCTKKLSSRQPSTKVSDIYQMHIIQKPSPFSAPKPK